MPSVKGLKIEILDLRSSWKEEALSLMISKCYYTNFLNILNYNKYYKIMFFFPNVNKY